MRKSLANLFVILALLAFGFIRGEAQEKYNVQKQKDANGYSYEFVKGDPVKLRIYSLDNGLKVYLRQNPDEPRIQTFIPVKAGSTYDPPQTTGLAHYLEHMMFKGTSRFGTMNWKDEEKLLVKISDLYEKHRNAKTVDEKAGIYATIDSISQIAAKLAVANEYDKMLLSIGARGTNAYTTDERTVYMNDIPANEFENWLKVESERFSKLVLRLFHTELEAVYEEFNMSQDNDYNKANEVLMAGLFKKHPYGTQTTIGKADHLKNPSLVNIHNYRNTYYVPNNMAICLSGDFDFDKTIQLIDKYFGKFKQGKVPKFKSPKEDEITQPLIKEVVGPDAEFVSIGYRLKGFNSKEKKYAELIDMMLNNSVAGLIDIDLVQKQKVLSASSYASANIDYGTFVLNGNPRQGQKLEEVKDLLLGEIEKIKNGTFDDWLIEAVINNLKLNRIRSQESNGIAHLFAYTFANGGQWADYVQAHDELDKVTKQDILNFAKETFKDNYVVVYKRTGADSTSVKVDKPKITPIQLNRDQQSEFIKDFLNSKSERLKPVFVNYDKEIIKYNLSNKIELNAIENKTNELFSLSYIIDIGGNHDLKIPLATEYLDYIGTDMYPSEQIKKEFYKVGVNFSVYSSDDRVYVTISGLYKNLPRGMELLENLITSSMGEPLSYNDYVDGILKKRSDNKLDKYSILWGGLYNYGMYGRQSPFTHIIPEPELRVIPFDELTKIVRELFNYKHYIFYYGKEPKKARELVEQYHKVPDLLQAIPQPMNFVEENFNEHQIYFVNYDMVQTMMVFLSKDLPFDAKLLPESRLFNEYYGDNMSSIIFQELRESKALAYSAYAGFSSPAKPDRSHFIYGLIATQPDKLKSAMDTFLDLLNILPTAQKQFDASRESIMKVIETERIIKSRIFWSYLRNKDRNINFDDRKDIYEKAKNGTIADVMNFFDKHVKGKKYSFMLIGKRENIDFKELEKIGKVRELTLEEVFGF
ncbi:MAG: protease3 [Ignavibacteria bacterium]|nr:protease3 [Ignavibacteria bacterium]